VRSLVLACSPQPCVSSGAIVARLAIAMLIKRASKSFEGNWPKAASAEYSTLHLHPTNPHRNIALIPKASRYLVRRAPGSRLSPPISLIHETTMRTIIGTDHRRIAETLPNPFPRFLKVISEDLQSLPLKVVRHLQTHHSSYLNDSIVNLVAESRTVSGMQRG
jgi:hypothetical protein